MKYVLTMAAALLMSWGTAYAQELPPSDWMHADKAADGMYGISSRKAYEYWLSKKQPTKKVIVAVIDSGVDIQHPDLKGKIWTNQLEVAGNGIDDDRNGYVDDIHGWNFIGSASGNNVGHDNLEVARLYKVLNQQFDGKKRSDVPKKQLGAYEAYLKVKAQYEKGFEEAKQNFSQYVALHTELSRANKLLTAYLDVDTLTLDLLDEVQSPDEQIMATTGFMKEILASGITEEMLQEGVDHFKNQVNYSYNQEFDSRKIIGDTLPSIGRFYGNSDVMGPDASHGTHVAGIIAANRGNGLGLDGIAEHVEIMSVRAVPDGDEHDKDIANAIRYAVDNGAKLINMSFGKSWSPDKVLVDEAVRYAMQRGVLIIHAAGNDGRNVDEYSNFPTARYADKGNAQNWIEVGASSWKNDEYLVCDFSNYSGTLVDIFAPGKDIFSTIPGDNYTYYDGTSMAAPVVSGIAAVLMSYYPDASASVIKEAILSSGIPVSDTVYQPRDGRDDPLKKVKFSTLSARGSIANLYQAIAYMEKHMSALRN